MHPSPLGVKNTNSVHLYANQPDTDVPTSEIRKRKMIFMGLKAKTCHFGRSSSLAAKSGQLLQ
jgi:hypothetical protein